MAGHEKGFSKAWQFLTYRLLGRWTIDPKGKFSVPFPFPFLLGSDPRDSPWANNKACGVSESLVPLSVCPPCQPYIWYYYDYGKHKQLEYQMVLVFFSPNISFFLEFLFPISKLLPFPSNFKLLSYQCFRLDSCAPRETNSFILAPRSVLPTASQDQEGNQGHFPFQIPSQLSNPGMMDVVLGSLWGHFTSWGVPLTPLPCWALGNMCLLSLAPLW